MDAKPDADGNGMVTATGLPEFLYRGYAIRYSIIIKPLKYMYICPS